MSELPLDRIEELVEESVFHPSPCKRHKERVLRHAVRATVRQTISRRTMAAVGAAALILGIVVVRFATSAGETPSTTAAPADTSAVETNGAAAPASTRPAPSGSMGEGLFQSPDEGTGRGAANQGL